ncbi:staphylopine family metallophore export MFS transporter CntE [Paenibacillus sp. YYML68]|uniref:staphylopine family metallophore export MFS transporter CntE n=1 Tax=Paenibacillus sp. YYML68 TaxID=2909250 RepID=UPI002492F20A|nr:MFS transporter [Paenibacillus sp. YYML68]
MKGALAWPFVRLYMLTLLYFSANSMLNVIIPLKGDSLGASNTAIGIIMGAYLFTSMLLRPWAGLLIQRYGALKVLRTILVINGSALLLYSFTGLEGYFFARVMQGVCTACFSMALQLGIIDALPEEDRSQGISLYSLCAFMPGILGPLLALGMWQSGDMQTFTYVMLAIAIMTGVVGYSARVDSHSAEAAVGVEAAKPAGGTSMQGAIILKSYREMVRNPHLFKCSVLMLTASLVFGAVTAFIPLYAMQIQGGNAGIYLMLQAATVVAARFLLRKRIPSDGKWHTGYIIMIVLTIAAAAQAVSVSIWGGVGFLYIGAIMMGAAQALLYPTLTTYLTFVLPKDNRNVLLGLFIATADLGSSLGGVIMGPIADMSSYSVMYMICAIVAVSMTVFAIQGRQRTAEAG